MEDEHKILIRADNRSTIALAQNPEFYTRIKHIDIRYHYIRDEVEDGKILIEYVSTNDMVADLLTKSLQRTKFERFLTAIGITNGREKDRAMPK